MAKRLILHNGKLKTISQIAKDENVSYHVIYQRYLADVSGKPKRSTGKKRVTWIGKDGKKHEFESISKLAEYLGVSREWARKLVSRKEKEQKRNKESKHE